MSTKFDWQAEDDESWGSPTLQKSDETKGLSSNRKWAVAFFIFLLLASVALLSFQQIQDYLSNTASDVQVDVLSSHELVLKAAIEVDQELMITVLSARDSEWTTSQLRLLEQDLLFDRRFFGFHWQPEASINNASVHLSPDLLEAQVVQDHNYLVTGVNGEPQVITLEQAISYRRGVERWLLSPPTRVFWGNTVPVQGLYFQVIFPERDEELGRRLAADIESALTEACYTNSELDCKSDIQLNVSFETDPEVLIDLVRPLSRSEADRGIKLPTPSLVGIPKDEIAYRALSRAYAERIVSAFIAQGGNSR